MGTLSNLVRVAGVIGAAAALAAAFAWSAGAQTTARPVLRPGVVAPVQAQPNAAASDPSVNLPPDPAALAREVGGLKREVRRLDGEIARLNGEIAALSTRVPYRCEGHRSINVATGASDDCTPYGCNAVTGLCRTTAAKSEHCAPGFLWCVNRNSCITPTGDC